MGLGEPLHPLDKLGQLRGHMARLGSTKRPLCVRVANDQQLRAVAEQCDRLGLHFIAELAPNEPEDLRDLEAALVPALPARRSPTVGRNDPCPCGSGRKFKKCCLDAASPTQA